MRTLCFCDFIRVSWGSVETCFTRRNNTSLYPRAYFVAPDLCPILPTMVVPNHFICWVTWCWHLHFNFCVYIFTKGGNTHHVSYPVCIFGVGCDIVYFIVVGYSKESRGKSGCCSRLHRMQNFLWPGHWIVSLDNLTSPDLYSHLWNVLFMRLLRSLKQQIAECFLHAQHKWVTNSERRICESQAPPKANLEGRAVCPELCPGLRVTCPPSRHVRT